MGRLHNLRAADAARLLVAEVLAAVETFPTKDPAGLRKQLSESANCVGANISEGYGRGTKGETLHHLRIARGSLEEMQHHWKVARRVGFIDDKTYHSVANKAIALERMISGLMRRTEAR